MAASGPATPSIAPWPNSSGCLDSFFSVAYDRKVGISAPPAGSAPNGKPNAVPRSHGFQDRFQSCSAHPRPADRDHLGGLAAQVRGDPQRLADGEDADRDHDHVDAVGELGDAEGEPLLSGHRVDPDQADHQAEQQRRRNRGSGTRRAPTVTATNASSMIAK